MGWEGDKICQPEDWKGELVGNQLGGDFPSGQGHVQGARELTLGLGGPMRLNAAKAAHRAAGLTIQWESHYQGKSMCKQDKSKTWLVCEGTNKTSSLL